jgi:acyl-coenzyme A synthetase/AMP-(fatty) acid ligase
MMMNVKDNVMASMGMSPDSGHVIVAVGRVGASHSQSREP